MPGLNGLSRWARNKKTLETTKGKGGQRHTDKVGGEGKWNKQARSWRRGNPHSPYTGALDGKLENIRLAEVNKAVESMAGGKAAGPDGTPVGIYRELPALWGPLRVLFDCILARGVIPAPLLLVHLVPLDKPKKDPERCSSKRPISLLNAMAKILEAAVHHRLLLLF